MISFNKEQDKAQEKAKEEIKKKKAEEEVDSGSLITTNDYA